MSAPDAEGVRVAYDDLPDAVHAWVDDVLGDPVVDAVTQPGGFSPGCAARLRTASGRRAFVKAVSSAINTFAADAHRDEIRNTSALPSIAPVPRLIASYDDAGWVALLLDDVDGRQPALPWRPDELARVVATLDELYDDLTPCPVADARDVTTGWREEFGNWRTAARDPLVGLDPWAARNLDRLAGLEAGSVTAAEGDTLLHLDVRADNLLLTDDRVWVVDWPWAARGAPVFDLVAWAPSVAMQGGPEPAELLAMSRYGAAADLDAVLPLAVAVAGYFHVNSLRPAPDGLPTVRAFQAAQAEPSLRWVRELIDGS